MASKIVDRKTDGVYEFPKDFLFGVATASYQIEGAWNENGKGENIWDRACHTDPGKIKDGSSGDIACDSYHKYKQDVQLLKQLGVDFYRFSLSWCRILPTGKTDQINQDGIRYYNDLINELLANNIKPYVTIFHWDLPQTLEDEGGWTNPKITEYFVDYCKVVFENFGDRVKHWFTMNEIQQFCLMGYGNGMYAPFLKNIEHAYEATHNALLAHAKAYRLYQKLFKAKQQGLIGIVIDGQWFEPNTDTKDDQEAAERMTLMNYGWYSYPIFKGNYPQLLIKRVAEASKKEGLSKSWLPEFTPEESTLIKGSCDFLGLNHYTSFKAQLAEEGTLPPKTHRNNCGVNIFHDPTWKGSSSWWLKVVPHGLKNILIWIKENYGNPPVLITENGYSDEGGLNDVDRVNYYKAYLTELLKAIHENDCKVIGYTAWSLMDNFEWISGYTECFGLHHVDFNDPERKRTPKLSADYYKSVIQNRKV